MDINKFIVDHASVLKRLIAAAMTIWFISGIFALDYLNSAIFVSIWIPLGILGAFFAKKW